MAAKLWLNGAGKLIVNGSGKPILCEVCPCGPAPVPVCCDSGSLPATATSTYTINALAPATANMDKVGAGYVNHTLLLCDLGDGHRQILYDIEITCSGGTWNLSFGYSVYTDGVLGNYVSWQRVFLAGTSYTEFSVSCSPFHLHYEQGNTGGVDADGASLACGGVTYPFAASGINLVLDMVTP